MAERFGHHPEESRKVVLSLRQRKERRHIVVSGKDSPYSLSRLKGESWFKRLLAFWPCQVSKRPHSSALKWEESFPNHQENMYPKLEQYATGACVCGCCLWKMLACGEQSKRKLVNSGLKEIKVYYAHIKMFYSASGENSHWLSKDFHEPNTQRASLSTIPTKQKATPIEAEHPRLRL